MQPVSDQELRLNEQAATIATLVLSQAVEAATRCEQLTTDMNAQTMGMEGLHRVDKALRGALTPRKARALNELKTAGLPKSIIFAVTSNHVHALEDKHDRGRLIAGRELKSWNRAGVRARHAAEGFYAGIVSNDREVLFIYLPIEAADGDNIRYLTSAARRRARTRGDTPHQFIFARDAPSQRLFDALGVTGPLLISGHGRQDPGGPAPSPLTSPAFTSPRPPTAQRLQELDTLRATGVISDAEYTRKREQIIAEM